MVMLQNCCSPTAASAHGPPMGSPRYQRQSELAATTANPQGTNLLMKNKDVGETGMGIHAGTWKLGEASWLLFQVMKPLGTVATPPWRWRSHAECHSKVLSYSCAGHAHCPTLPCCSPECRTPRFSSQTHCSCQTVVKFNTITLTK